MTPLPQVNCTLTAIEGGGVSHDYRTPGAPVAKWSGQSGAFIDDRIVSMLNGNGDLNRVQKITLYVDADLPVTPPVKPGDTVLWQLGDTTYSARIQNVATPRLMGAPTYSTLALEQINAA